MTDKSSILGGANGEELGKNQSFARVLNNRIVLSELRKQPLSGTELSSMLKLSNATLSSILKSLLQEGLIKVLPQESKTSKGRSRIVYTINENYGLVAIFSITSYRSNPAIVNLRGESIYESERKLADYSFKTFKKEIDNIKDVLSRSVYQNVPIRYVVLSLPGLVNKKTGELQVSPQFNKELFSDSETLSQFFRNEFNCPVLLENDTKLMMLAELSSSSFKGSDAGLLAYIDYGIGGAFEFSQELYLGSRGYAGEIGRLVVKVDDESHHLDDFTSLRRMTEKVSEKKGYEVSMTELLSLYESGDKETKSIVLLGAKALGKAFKELVRVIDIDRFIISGFATNFGDEYLNTVIDEIEQANENVLVRYSTIDENSIMCGGKELAISNALKEALDKIQER